MNKISEIKPVYMTKGQVFEKFGSHFSVVKDTTLSLNTIKSFCELFTQEPKIYIKLKEYLGNSFNPDNDFVTLEDAESNILNTLYDKMQSIIEDRKKRLEQYNNAGFLQKARFKLACMLSEEGDKNEPEYVQKGVDYLSLKTIEDLKNKIIIAVEQIDQDDMDCVLVPENLDQILNIDHLYLTVHKTNVLKMDVHAIKLSDKKLVFVNNENAYLKMEGYVLGSENDKFSIELSLQDGVFLFKNNLTYHEFFIKELDAISALIDTLNERSKVLEEETKRLKLIRDKVGKIGDLNQPKRLEFKINN